MLLEYKKKRLICVSAERSWAAKDKNNWSRVDRGEQHFPHNLFTGKKKRLMEGRVAVWCKNNGEDMSANIKKV